MTAPTSSGRGCSTWLAAEGQQLLRQRRRALAGLQDLADVAAQRVGARELVEHEQLRIADDHGEQVVEVVRDAAGELADGFHLLRLDEAAPRAASRR